MYKPNFCGECGERIERERWHVFTSRHFCPLCDRKFRRSKIVRGLILFSAILLSGIVIGRVTKPSPNILVIERDGAHREPLDTNALTRASQKLNRTSEANGGDGVVGGTSVEPPTDPNEVISICGARTKKGTACQRRVRGTGRCWQHIGKPGMKPPEKLVVNGGK